MKANESNNNANNVQANAQVEQPQATATDEKVVKNTEKYLKDNTKPTDVKRDVNGFKDGGTTIATATATKFEKLGKFIAKFQAIEARDGGKTVYIFETAEKVFVGYTSSELSDVFNLPKREYKSTESKSTSPAVCELRKLKNYIDNLTSPLAIAICNGMSEKIIDSISYIIECEKAFDDFCAKYKTQIEQAQRCTLEVATAFCGSEFIKEFHDFGFKCADEKESDTTTDTAKESTEESNQQTEQTEESEKSESK